MKKTKKNYRISLSIVSILVIMLVFAGLKNTAENEHTKDNDTNTGIIKTDRFKLERLTFFNKNAEQYDFKLPLCLQCAGEKYYIIDMNIGILEFNAKKEYHQKIFSYGQGPKEIGAHTSFMTVKGSDLYIVDTLNGRVHVYDTLNGAYSITRKPFMTYFINVTLYKDRLWFGAYNAVYEMDNDNKIVKHRLFEKNSPHARTTLTALWGSHIIAVSKGIYEDNSIAIFKQGDDGDFKPDFIEFELNKDIERFKKKDSHNFFKTVLVYKEQLYINTNMVNSMNGALIFKIDKKNNISTFYIENSSGITFVESGGRKFLTDDYEAAIYEIIE